MPTGPGLGIELDRDALAFYGEHLRALRRVRGLRADHPGVAIAGRAARRPTLMQTFTPDDLKHHSPAHEPIGTVAPGETFTVVTEDCFTGRYETPDGFTAESAAWVEENLNGVRPIAVRRAEPGEVVAVAIEELRGDDSGSGGRQPL